MSNSAAASHAAQPLPACIYSFTCMSTAHSAFHYRCVDVRGAAVADICLHCAVTCAAVVHAAAAACQLGALGALALLGAGVYVFARKAIK
jgi:hypothetical protein